MKPWLPVEDAHSLEHRWDLLPILQDAPGFIRYGLADAGDGTVLSVSIWSSHDDAERATELAATWVAEAIADRVALVAANVGDFRFYEGARSAL